MGMATITEELKALASTAITRSLRGITCLILDDPNVKGLHTYARLKNVIENYSAKNKAIITRCFADRGVKTLKVVCYDSSSSSSTSSSSTSVVGQAIVGQAVVGSNAVREDVSVALKLLEGTKFNYLADPYANDVDNVKIANFIKAQRKANNILVNSVLNNNVADFEGVINFINNSVSIGTTVYTGTEFCVDIACLASTCTLDSSLTNATVDGVTSVDDVGADKDSLVDAGKLFLYYDNDLESVVLSRAVNSKTTIGTNEKESMKKIRIMSILDMIRDDLKCTFKRNYQGKVDNSLANKKLLVSSYNTYLRSLVKAGALSETETSYTELDVDATIKYLEDVKGMDCSNMTDAQILAESTDEKVFVKGTVYVLDVAEDLGLVLNF